MVLHCLESKKGPGKGASLFVAVKAASEAVCCSGGVVSTHGGWRAAGGASKPEAAAHTQCVTAFWRPSAAPSHIVRN